MVGLGLVFFTMALLMVQEAAAGTVFLDHNVEIVGEAGKRIVDVVVPQHRNLGLQKFATKRLENLTAIALSEKDYGMVCQWLFEARFDEASDFFAGVDIMFFNQDLGCPGDYEIGTWGNPVYFRKWCVNTPILLAHSQSWYPGIFTNFRTPHDDLVNDWIAEGHPCYILFGIYDETLNAVVSSEQGESKRFQVSILWDDENFAQDLLDSLMIQIIFRAIFPILFLFCFLRSAAILYQRIVMRKLTLDYAIMLIPNTFQGLLFFFVDAIGNQFFSDVLPSAVVFIFFAHLYGFSVATDLTFASMLAEVKNRVTRFSSTPQSKNRFLRWEKILVVAFALSLCAVEVLMAIYLALTQTYDASLFVTSYYPTFLVVVNIFTMLALIREQKQLARILLSTGDDVKTNAAIAAQRSLAKIFLFYSKLAILSFVFCMIGMVLFGFNVFGKLKYMYLVTMFSLNMSKVLNLYSQSSCCVIPHWHQGKENKRSSIVPRVLLGLGSENANNTTVSSLK